MDKPHLIGRYEQKINSYRLHWLNGRIFQILTDKNMSRALLLLFWWHFSKYGILMTAPVERWIQQASESCIEKGFEEWGVKLLKQAERIKDHHLMMANDLQSLEVIARRDLGMKIQINAVNFHETPPSIMDFIALHENNIEGPKPYGQLAIGYEIERLSVKLSPVLINHTENIFPALVRESLSYVQNHVQSNLTYAKLSQETLAEFLQVNPTALNHLVEMGSRALAAYMGFLQSCLLLAENTMDMILVE